MEKGFKPTLSIFGNTASHAVKKYIKKQKVNLWLVPPHQHHINAIKQAMQTFNDHFIVALCTTYPASPI